MTLETIGKRFLKVLQLKISWIYDRLLANSFIKLKFKTHFPSMLLQDLALSTMIEKICPLQYSEDINSSLKPIHIAEKWGQLEVLKYILSQMEVKDPKTHDGQRWNFKEL